ncbi:trypsin-like peptidase domain-containing protein [Chitinophagaceae bacterium MMS25-I14]
MKFRIFPVIITAAITSLSTLFVAARFQHQLPFASAPESRTLPVNYASYDETAGRLNNAAPVDFQHAAEGAVKAVVHIKTSTKARTVVAQDPSFGDDFFGDLFGRRQYYIPPQMGSGSGVVISPDGYIVTNNHVIAGADQVTVTFNDRDTRTAQVVAKDASTDIALLKVPDSKDLPYMEFGNSDNVHLGQWVLAVGYPLTLDATVTAGIVSAKSRSIGINRSQSGNAIESFIQTDAAVNPGNSGGALVNTDGQLIGINAAIASPTGSYAGYSYAIPANIVRKVANDLMKYGTVQRAYMGIRYLDRKIATPDEINGYGLDKNDGVYVAEVLPQTGAEKAGIRKGDFITQINNVAVHSEPELQEQIARYKPGDNISVSYVRNGKTEISSIELKSLSNNTRVVKNDGSVLLLGATFRQLTQQEMNSYGVGGGAVVTETGNGPLARQTRIKKGFVITSINDQAVNNPADVQQIVSSQSNIQIAGFYPGVKGMYYYGLSDTNDSGGNQ